MNRAPDIDAAWKLAQDTPSEPQYVSRLRVLADAIRAATQHDVLDTRARWIEGKIRSARHGVNT